MMEAELGEITIRTRTGRLLFAVQVHLIGYRTTGNRWAFIQFGNKTFWLRRP